MNALAQFLAHHSTKKIRDDDDEFVYYTCMQDTAVEKSTPNPTTYKNHCIRGLYESELTPSYKPIVIQMNKNIQTIFEQAFFHTLFPRHRLYYKNPFTDSLV